MSSGTKSEQKKLIVVTGASGAQGGSVVSHLVDSGRFRIRALVKDASEDKMSALKKMEGVEIMEVDISKPETIRKAFQGAHAAFGVTDYWCDPERMSKEEYHQGRTLIDAAIEAKLKFFIWSSLPDVRGISDGKIELPNFTNKYRVEQYARDKKSDTIFSFLYAGFYLQNLTFLHNIYVKDDILQNEPLPIREETKLPVINVNELGKYVLHMLENHESMQNKRVYAANEYITFPDLLKLVGDKIGLKSRFTKCTRDEYKETTDTKETRQMFEWANEYGYFNGEPLFEPRLGLKLSESVNNAGIDWKKVCSSERLTSFRDAISDKQQQLLGQQREVGGVERGSSKAAE